MAHTRSELLELLNSRKAWDLPPYKSPFHNNADLQKIEQAARLHAHAEDSDPNAYLRMLHYLLLGFELASDILDQSKSRISRRNHETHTEFEALNVIKRQQDTDRAWNQHRASMYQAA